MFSIPNLFIEIQLKNEQNDNITIKFNGSIHFGV